MWIGNKGRGNETASMIYEMLDVYCNITKSNETLYGITV